ncbi:MAG: hypothetical protein U0L74_10790 [Paludibacteraceae bacterium]|nr:hypothetical protein [Paludibacteraceae bacterium]
MKKFLQILSLIFFCSCNSKNSTIEKWIEEANNINSIKIMPHDTCSDLKVEGLTLQQIEKLYGKYDLIFNENRIIQSPSDVIEGEEFYEFKESDFPIEICECVWIRDTRIKKLLLKNEDYYSFIHNSNEDLGMCIDIYFVKYNEQFIAFRSMQYPLKYLFLE